MKTTLTKHEEELCYLAGYLATRKAKVERFGPIVSVAMWARDGSYHWCEEMLRRHGGGIVYRQKYLVWSLAGQAAVGLLQEVLPIVARFTPELAEHICTVLADKPAVPEGP